MWWLEQVAIKERNLRNITEADSDKSCKNCSFFMVISGVHSCGYAPHGMQTTVFRTCDRFQRRD
jgi:hypothetical protein